MRFLLTTTEGEAEVRDTHDCGLDRIEGGQWANPGLPWITGLSISRR
jgi:hypothetical protein